MLINAHRVCDTTATNNARFFLGFSRLAALIRFVISRPYQRNGENKLDIEKANRGKKQRQKI